MNTISSNPPRLELDGRTLVAYRHSWNLTNLERYALDKFVLIQSTVKDVEALINTDHDFKDFIHLGTEIYRAFYLNTNSDHLTKLSESADTMNEKVYISLRRLDAAGLSVALISHLPHHVPELSAHAHTLEKYLASQIQLV